MMQHSKSSPSNNEGTITKRLSQNQAMQNILTYQDTSPAISIGPEKQINASSLHNYITWKMNQESYLGNSFHGIPKHNPPTKFPAGEQLLLPNEATQQKFT